MFADIFTWQRLAGCAVAVACSIAWDLYWGFTWFTYFFDRPVYRAEEPALFWKIEAAQIVVGLVLSVPVMIKLLGWLAG